MDVIASLPVPSDRRIAVRVTADAARQLRSGHPWVFDRGITSTTADAGSSPGDLAVVFDPKRSFVAIGLYDPASPIRVRVLRHGAPETIDERWWERQVDAALTRRADLAASAATTAYRCIHGENDGFPGLVLDRYATTYVLKLYSAAWVPHLPALLAVIGARVGCERMVLRLSRGVQRGGPLPGGLFDGATLLGDPPLGPVRFRENGLAFEADVLHGQKTGHFLDQRENRARVRDLAGDGRVLDVFACTGGFSVHAAAGGANAVHSVDASPHAIDAARRNVELNRDLAAVRRCHHTTEAADAFESMQGLADRGRRFDLVIVDPPSFAQKQADVDAAVRAYRRLTGLGARLVAPGGVLVQASCSSRVPAERFFDIVTDGIRAAGRPMTVLATTRHPSDHPVGFAQGAYLKAAFVRL